MAPIINYIQTAVHMEPSWYKAWHLWAAMHLQLVQSFEKEVGQPNKPTAKVKKQNRKQRRKKRKSEKTKEEKLVESMAAMHLQLVQSLEMEIGPNKPTAR